MFIGLDREREPRVCDSHRAVFRTVTHTTASAVADRKPISLPSDFVLVGQPRRVPAGVHLPTATQYTDGRLAPYILGRLRSFRNELIVLAASGCTARMAQAFRVPVPAMVITRSTEPRREVLGLGGAREARRPHSKNS
jgi:hypothetical protein